MTLAPCYGSAATRLDSLDALQVKALPWQAALGEHWRKLLALKLSQAAVFLLALRVLHNIWTSSILKKFFYGLRQLADTSDVTVMASIAPILANSPAKHKLRSSQGSKIADNGNPSVYEITAENKNYVNSTSLGLVIPRGSSPKTQTSLQCPTAGSSHAHWSE